MRKKVWRKKFAAIAARDRQFTVKNNTIPKSDKEYFMIPWSSKNTDTTGNYWFVPGVPGAMFIKNDKPDPKTGNHYTPVDHSWKPKKSPQPKRLQHSWKGWIQVKDEVSGLWTKKFVHHKSDYIPYNKLKDKPKMNHVEYMEKLTQHKLAKWERKNPKPLDMFTEEVEKWKQQRETAEERLRDFVVSIYDKLRVLGNRIDRKSGTIVGKTEAKIKDVDGKGHDVNYPHLQESDQLYKNATKVAQDIIDKDGSIIDCDLENHKGNQKRPLIHAKRNKTTFAKTNIKDYKRQKDRIILPQAA